MGLYAIKVPDVGEGVAEAELVEWHVAVGDLVKKDDVIAALMTDKATVEIPSSVSGTVVALGGGVGDTLAVGSELIRLEVAGDGNVKDPPADQPSARGGSSPSATVDGKAAATKPLDKPAETRVERPAVARAAPEPVRQRQDRSREAASPRPESASRAAAARPLASPSVRRRAREAGIELVSIDGAGPGGRITHDDLDEYLAGGRARNGSRRRSTAVTEIKIVGVRRRIAERMSLANARIPHITIVEEVDMTSLEGLREELNGGDTSRQPRLTVLPFVVMAIVAAVKEQPQFNANFDDEAGVIRQFGAVHVGIATQTENGLMVPVIRHAEANSIWDNAREVVRLAGAARDATADRSELTGSTITITSLGPLGAIVTTPIINYPEVAIVGVNKMSIRPWWDGQQFVPRKMMNISCSFDHRVVDGYEAAVFVQKLKTLLERPAMLFVGGGPDA
ncbi:MAG: dihydrolipoamide acetyltransferase family protein [Hyphomicrobiaceae bacterium]